MLKTCVENEGYKVHVPLHIVFNCNYVHASVYTCACAMYMNNHVIQYTTYTKEGRRRRKIQTEQTHNLKQPQRLRNVYALSTSSLEKNNVHTLSASTSIHVHIYMYMHVYNLWQYH